MDSNDTPWLADIKRQVLDPALREMGLDPDRYALAWELDPAPLAPPPAPWKPPLTNYQAKLVRDIAQKLDIPQAVAERHGGYHSPWLAAQEELLRPDAWQRAVWDARHDLPEWQDPQQVYRDRIGEQAGIDSFERTRRSWTPVWKHVGGRALHAFIDGQEGPACGIRPVRASGRASTWRTAAPDRPSWWSRRSQHWECQRAVEAHHRALLRGEA
jgi:hypothetical protein